MTEEAPEDVPFSGEKDVEAEKPATEAPPAEAPPEGEAAPAKPDPAKPDPARPDPAKPDADADAEKDAVAEEAAPTPMKKKTIEYGETIDDYLWDLVGVVGETPVGEGDFRDSGPVQVRGGTFGRGDVVGFTLFLIN